MAATSSSGGNNRLLRKEVESLNGRLRKFNQENDDLLQRLSDLKFQKERKEEEFEQERLILRTKIRDLERGQKELQGQKEPSKQQEEEELTRRRQVEGQRQEHVRRERELLERLNSIRTENEGKERGWKKEMDQLKVAIQSKMKIIEEMRLEKDRLVVNSRPVEEERRLRQEVTEMKRLMEAEVRELRDARRENDELRKGIDGRTEGTRRRMDELIEALRLKERELDEAKREIVRRATNIRNSDLSSKEREASLRREIDRLSAIVEAKQNLLEESAIKDQVRLRQLAELQLNNGGGGDRVARLEQEVDRLNSMLTSKERQLQETTNDRQRMKEELEKGKVNDREGLESLRNEVDRLTVNVRSKEILFEESLAKNGELSAANEQLDRDLRETRSFLKSTSDTNQDLVDKNLKLERALAKTTKSANEQHQPTTEEKVSPYLRTLLREQESHIEDLQRQVGTIRTAIMDNAKTKQLAILAAAIPEIEPVLGDHKDVKQGDGLFRELKQARRNLDFSQRRISQLESWLDEIYTTTGGTGGGGGVGSVGRPGAMGRRQRPSGSRSVLAARTAAARDVLALPGIADLDEYTMDRTYSNLRSSRQLMATAVNNRRNRPSWNITTSTS